MAELTWALGSYKACFQTLWLCLLSANLQPLSVGFSTHMHKHTHAHNKKGCAALLYPERKLIPCYEFSHPLNLSAHVEVLPARDEERERKGKRDGWAGLETSNGVKASRHVWPPTRVHVRLRVRKTGPSAQGYVRTSISFAMAAGLINIQLWRSRAEELKKKREIRLWEGWRRGDGAMSVIKKSIWIQDIITAVEIGLLALTKHWLIMLLLDFGSKRNFRLPPILHQLYGNVIQKLQLLLSHEWMLPFIVKAVVRSQQEKQGEWFCHFCFFFTYDV